MAEDLRDSPEPSPSGAKNAVGEESYLLSSGFLGHDSQFSDLFLTGHTFGS